MKIRYETRWAVWTLVAALAYAAVAVSPPFISMPAYFAILFAAATAPIGAVLAKKAHPAVRPFALGMLILPAMFLASLMFSMGTLGLWEVLASGPTIPLGHELAMAVRTFAIIGTQFTCGYAVYRSWRARVHDDDSLPLVRQVSLKQMLTLMVVVSLAMAYCFTLASFLAVLVLAWLYFVTIAMIVGGLVYRRGRTFAFYCAVAPVPTVLFLGPFFNEDVSRSVAWVLTRGDFEVANRIYALTVLVLPTWSGGFVAAATYRLATATAIDDETRHTSTPADDEDIILSEVVRERSE